MVKKNPIKAPPGLESSKKIWRDITNDYVDFEQHHLRILELICKTWDEIIEAQEVLQEKGKYYTDRYGQPKEHPAVNGVRKNKAIFMRLVDLPPAVVPSFKLGWGSSQARDPGGA